MGYVSFWRNCERVGFVSSVFAVPVNVEFGFWRTFMDFVSFAEPGVPVNVWISSVFGVTVNVWVSSRQFLACL